MTWRDHDERAATRVLLVDDALDLRMFLRVALESAGTFDVVGEASDGQAAIDLAARLSPDVIVLDHMMPVMTGLEALPHLRRVAPHAKVALFSAVADRLDMSGLREPPDLVVVKGGDVREFVAKLAELS